MILPLAYVEFFICYSPPFKVQVNLKPNITVYSLKGLCRPTGIQNHMLAYLISAQLTAAEQWFHLHKVRPLGPLAFPPEGVSDLDVSRLMATLSSLKRATVIRQAFSWVSRRFPPVELWHIHLAFSTPIVRSTTKRLRSGCKNALVWWGHKPRSEGKTSVTYFTFL